MPPAAALTLLWIAFFGFAAFSMLVTVASISTRDASLGPTLISSIGLPALAVLLFIGALLPMRAGLRVILFGGAAAAMTLGALGMVLFVTDNTADARTGSLVLLAACLAPTFAITLVPGLSFAIRSVPELQDVLRAARAERVSEIVYSRSDPTLTEIATDLRLSEDKTAQLLRALIQGGVLMGVFDEQSGRFYSAASLAEKQRRFLAVVQAHGKIHLEDAAAELRVPAGQVHNWIYDLVQRGQFRGSVDWNKRLLYSLEASAMQEENCCPHCGGELDIVGQGLIRCCHCAVEIFLSEKQA